LKQGWFIDLAGTYSIFASSGCTYHKMSTYYGGFNSDPAVKQHQFGFSGRVGRRVSPNVAWRVGYERHLASNMLGNKASGRTFMFKDLFFDAMVSPLDALFGYNPDRFYTMWVYGGVGLLAWDETTARRPYNLLIHWRSDLEFGLRGGIMNNFRLSDSFDLHVDLTAVATKWNFDAPVIGPGSLWHRAHFDFSGMVGIMWYIGGRTFEQVVIEENVVETDCSAQDRRIEELLAELAECQAKNNEQQPCDTVTVEVPGKSICYPFSIFFNKGSYEFRDSRDVENLKKFAEFAKENKDIKIVLQGSADSATGSSSFNKTLSDKRCEKVRAELVKNGVPESNIKDDSLGGVDILKPAENNRRVLIRFE
jgi:outer membrane protein OmpA-like peptidoglycan-associated protein